MNSDRPLIAARIHMAHESMKEAREAKAPPRDPDDLDKVRARYEAMMGDLWNVGKDAAELVMFPYTTGLPVDFSADDLRIARDRL